MNFYEVGDNQWGSRSNRGFTYAAGYNPLPEGLPFLLPAFLEAKLASWQVNGCRPPGLMIDRTGSKWPDFLMNGGGPPAYFVSEKVIESLRRESITPARLTEMPISQMQARKLRDIPPPRYFVLEMEWGIEVDYPKSGVPTDTAGKPIFDPLPKPWPPAQWYLKLASWSGADLFGWPAGPDNMSTGLICTDRIVELAKRDGWTNVKFEPIAAV